MAIATNLVGFILSLTATTKQKYYCNDGKIVTIYFTNCVWGCGVSLGNYILLDVSYYNRDTLNLSVNHEHGHQKQSLYLGWFYLIFVGLVSALFNNIWDRLFHKYWSNKKRNKWYYNRYPEKWADRLGDVKR